MISEALRKNVFTVLFVIGFFLTVFLLYLYHYAYFCQWSFNESEGRILFLADPQMEGDARVRRQGKYGELDLAVNDYFFKHIVDSMVHYLKPQYVFVLGDLFSSQTISDEEFAVRVERYRWIFQNVNVPLYNITGNHDVGYAAEVTEHRVDRFENAFGKVNDKVVIADHIFAIVNSVNIDSSYEKELSTGVWDHMNSVVQEATTSQQPVVLVTHIPLHKEKYEAENFLGLNRVSELCIDREYTRYDTDGNVVVQNMLSVSSTDFILNEMQPAFVFNGHDHDGCIYRHNKKTVEYTVRSMMGDYGGYAALFEIKKAPSLGSEQNFEYSYTACPFVTTRLIVVTMIVLASWVVVLLSTVIFFGFIWEQKKLPMRMPVEEHLYHAKSA